MSVFSDAIDDIYADDDLMKSAVLTISGGGPAAINVFFTAPYQVVSPYDGEVATTAPQARCRTSDIAAASAGDIIEIDSVSYTITAIEPLEQGLEKILILRRT